MNSNVTATGMQVTAQADSSLLIGRTNVPDAATVKFNDTTDTFPTALIPCTYFDANEITAAGVNAEGYYQANLEDATAGLWVDPNTGLKKEDTDDKTWSAAYTAADEKCYKDFIVWIATAGEEMTNAKLSATFKITNPAVAGDDKDTTTVGDWTHKALTIDIKVATVGSSWNNSWDDLTSVTMKTVKNYDNTTLTIDDLYTGKIGTQRSTDTLVVVMRVYFDGAATDSANSKQAYVNSANVDLEALQIDVDFSAALVS